MQFIARCRINVSAADLFRWHAEPGALERLTPPWERLEIVQRAPGIRDGDRGAFRVRVGPLRILWTFEHRNYIENRQFRDVQLSGPFRRWEHTHIFIPEGDHACSLEDQIDYDLPFGALGNLFGARFIRAKLQRVFAYRHKVTQEAMNSRPKA